MDPFPLILQEVIEAPLYFGGRCGPGHESMPMLYVAVGFVLISFGAGLEGVLFDLTPLTLYQASMVHTAVLVVGMSLFLYSVYGQPVPRIGRQTREGNM